MSEKEKEAREELNEHKSAGGEHAARFYYYQRTCSCSFEDWKSCSTTEECGLSVVF